jgi:hypothetical protein
MLLIYGADALKNGCAGIKLEKMLMNKRQRGFAVIGWERLGKILII